MRLLALLALLLAGCAAPRDGAITQVSTINALLAGDFDGKVSLGALAEYGDLGIGTFDRLDGEMVLLDGRFHQAKADGSVADPPAGMTTPFATVTRFRPTARHEVESPLDLRGIERVLDGMFPDPNAFCAVRARGGFARVKVRSVPPQRKPYPLLLEASRKQAVFERRDLQGTLVGFRAPAWAGRLAVPGAHLHFVSDDGRVAGHVLDCAMARGAIEGQACERFTMLLPRGGEGRAPLDLGADRSRELKQVESDRR